MGELRERMSVEGGKCIKDLHLPGMVAFDLCCVVLDLPWALC